jgi:glycosyltransferase involved in cell wall biosynthesis
MPQDLIQLPNRGRGKRLVVVMPALNEAATVASVIAAIPTRIAGITDIRVVVIDDGSSDDTRRRAETAGALVISNPSSRGLANAYRTATREALRLGADVMVHLDSDGQHDPAAMPSLVTPIVTQQADIVVGVRSLKNADQMSPLRRYGNRLGSAVFRRLLGIDVDDFTSGYRAFSRDALLHLNITSDYTHTLETLVQASQKRLRIHQVTVPVLEREHGESRMTKHIVRYIGRAASQALRSILHQNPLALFGSAALGMFLVAATLTCWFLVAYNSDGGLHLPSLLGAVLATVIGIGLFVGGLIADGVNANRRLLEEALLRLKMLELGADRDVPAVAHEPSDLAA